MTFELVINPGSELLATAGEALSRVRMQEPEFPPSALDHVWMSIPNLAERRKVRHATYSAWLAAQEDVTYHWRAAALTGAQIAAHIAICPPRQATVDALQNLRLDPAGMAELAKLYVDPYIQHRGIADQLLTAALGECCRRKLQPVLWAHVDSPGATRLYEHHGFTTIDTLGFPEGHYRLMLRTSSPVDACSVM